jgi:hypothetical protein
MGKWGIARLSAASGAIFVVVVSVALFLPGKPPHASDSAAQIASAVAGHRSAFLVGTYLSGVALVFGAWFFVAVRAWLAETLPGRDEPYAGVALAGGFFALVLMLLGFVLFYGVAFEVAPAGDLAVVRGLADAGNSSFELAKFGLAMFVVSTSLATRRDAILPGWFTLAGLSAGPIAIVGAIALFATGSATEVGSTFDALTAIPAGLWIFLLSVRMARLHPDIEQVEPLAGA